MIRFFWEAPSTGTHLPRGKNELDACSRVCHAWNAIALPHLFGDVVYTFCSVPTDMDVGGDGEYPRGHDDCVVFDGYSERMRDIRFKTFHMFLAFVKRSCIAQNGIKRLRLETWPTDIIVDERLYW